MKYFFLFLFVIYSINATADYLLVNRIANLRVSPVADAPVLEKLNVGDSLYLINSKQSDGFYHVISYSSGQQGWVYRTLVKKLPGEIDRPEHPDSASVAEVRVLDVGAGLCALIKLPLERYIVYDAGGIYTSGDSTFRQIKEYIPLGSEIDLMIISHTDHDHLIAASQVIKNYKVKKILWGGYEGSMIAGNASAGYQRLIAALNSSPHTENVNLNARDSMLTPGSSFKIGKAKFTFLCGFGKPMDEWDLSDRGEKLNSVSIVMKMEYGKNSVLFCGDALGRHLEDADDALIATEKFMVENAPQFLQSTIVIAPHHGARNASAKAFVDLVKPKAVIFPSGHKFAHPSEMAVKRYLKYVDTAQIFRTDRGDDEGGHEWTHGRKLNCKDKYNDDDIQVQLRSNNTYRVFYLKPDGPCK